MKHFFIIFFGIVLFLCFTSNIANAQMGQPQQEIFIKARVVKIVHQGEERFGSMTTFVQQLQVSLLEGTDKGKQILVERNGDVSSSAHQQIVPGDIVIINGQQFSDGKMQYLLYEPYRLNMLWIILTIFLIFICIIAGRKGVSALVGLVISILIIALLIIPEILAGMNPLSAAIIGSLIILIVSTFTAHGISFKTTIAVISTAIALCLAGLSALAITVLLRVAGLGNENSYLLQIGPSLSIDPRGLLLGGILISTLGALNDVTVTQSVTMFTLIKDHPNQKMKHIFLKGMVIGKEHIASLINTLGLAYAGTSLSVLIFFKLNPAHLPWWVILNNEATMEEIIRTIVGSTAVMLAVPITTILAVQFGNWQSHLTLKEKFVEATMEKPKNNN